jgi:hypothetical protein
VKKVFLFLGLLTIGATSCKKDWTCSCETKSVLLNQSYAPIYEKVKNSAPYNYTQDLAITNQDESSATKKCNEAQSSKTLQDGVMNSTAVYTKTTSNCTLR